MRGASNIPDGITVSLEKLNKVSVSKNKKSVVIEPGNNWGQVYAALNNQDVIVTGGRVSLVGTGGLTLGGACTSGYRTLLGRNANNLFQAVSLTLPISTAGLATMSSRMRSSLPLV